MLVLSIWYYLTGHVRVRVQGVSLEKFVNLCISRGLFLWNVKRQADWLEVNMGVNSFRMLRPLVRATGCRVKILQKQGLPFYLHRLRGRAILVVGGLLFFAIMYVLGSFVWTVEVTGIGDPAKVNLILEEAARHGAYPGVAKRKVDGEELGRQIIMKMPDLAWVQVDTRGTQLIIDVVPKELQPKVGLPAHLVAKKDGLVQEVTVLVGEPMVSQGQIVERGEVLIKGLMGERPVQAQGIVWATVWHEAYGTVSRQEVIQHPTGNTQRRVTLAWEQQEISFGQSKEPPFTNYTETVEHKGVALWRNISLPVEAIIRTYHEVEEEVRMLSVEEAEAKAKSQAMAKIHSGLSSDARIRSEEVRRMPSGQLDQVTVKVVVEVMENIAEPRDFEPESLAAERGQELEGNEGGQGNGSQQ